MVQTPHLLALPAEQRSSQIFRTSFVLCQLIDVQRNGRYVLLHSHIRLRTTTLPSLRGRVATSCFFLSELSRLPFRDFELGSLFYDQDDLVVPCVSDAEEDAVDSMKILSRPNLDHLEVKNETKSRYLVDDDWICHSRLLLSLINYRKSFTCELHIVATDDGSEGETQFTAVYSAGKLKFAYHGRVKKNLEREKLLHKAIYLDGGAGMIRWMTEPGQPDRTKFEPDSKARRRLYEIIDEDWFEVFERALDEFCASSTSS